MDTAGGVSGGGGAGEIHFELPSVLRVFKDGRVERLAEAEHIPASAAADPLTGVSTKDVTIDPSAGVTARLFLPSPSTGDEPHSKNKKLPILVYFHGGGFCLGSAFAAHYHAYCTHVAASARALVVSVEYRLAPETPLPAAYDDCWASMRWAAAASDAWLAEHGDTARVYLAGDSAGANIVHHMALRAGSAGVAVEGVALIHPYFWGAEAIGEETRDEGTRAKMEGMWAVACPSHPSAEDPLINPLAPGAPEMTGPACRRVLVAVAEEDLLRERGRAYYDWVKESAGGEGEVELMETAGKGHVFHLYDFTSPEAVEMTERLAGFLK